ncbi:MAG: choice-of-anchor I family protein [Thiobacillus sp.]
MRLKPLSILLAGLTLAANAQAASPLTFSKLWTANSATAGFLSEIPAFDAATNTVWVAGVNGVDVLNALSGSLVQHIDTTAFGSINSVAIHNGMAAFAMESTVRTDPGQVVFFDTLSRTQNGAAITVGALPDMLTFTPDGSKLLVANEATPTTYGTLASTSATGTRSYNPAVNDPVGSVSIIDMGTRTVAATATFAGVTQTGSNLRLNTGMDFEPEYITVNADGSRAFVSLQEANGMAVLNLSTNTFEKVVGLGAKDFSQPGNQIDPLNNGTTAFISPNVKGLYMPDGMAAFDKNGVTYVVMANEGDFREDDADRSAASSYGAASPLNNLRVSNTDSSTVAGELYTAGARSFSIRDVDGNLVFDSGDTLDKEAALRGIYDDGRSRDKGVEPEGVELMEIGGRTFAFIGLERTLKAAIAVYDITDPANASFIDMIVTDGDRAPEGLKGFSIGGVNYLAIANEGSGATLSSTSVYQLAAVPEPETYAMLLAGLGMVGFMAKRRKSVN